MKYPELEKRLQHDLEIAVNFLRSSLKNDLLAVVLMGGYARGEGTTLDGKNPYNDYDLLVVGPSISYCHLKKMQQRCKELEDQLSDLLHFRTEVAYQSLNSLSHAELSLMNIELKQGHRVLFGPSDCLQAMPPYTFKDIPLTEGTRLLVNRGTLLLEPQQEIKYLTKVCLAMGDTFLLQKGCYTLLYAEKDKQIERVGAEPWLIDYYKKAIDFKLKGKIPSLSYEEIKSHFIRYFFSYESFRLHYSFTTIDAYAEALSSSSTPLSIKNLLLNLYLFKQKAFSPSFRWALHHPRFRLCPALLSLLEGKNPEKWIDTYPYRQLWSRLT